MQIPEGMPSWIPYLSQFYWTLISVPAILVLALAIGYRFTRDGQLVLAREQGTSIRASRGLVFFTGFGLSTVVLGWIANAVQSVITSWAFLQYNFRLGPVGGVGAGQRTINWQADLLLVGMIETLVLAVAVSLIVAPPRKPVFTDEETAPVEEPRPADRHRGIPRLGTSEQR
jgi:hypothetical protein